MDQRIIPLLTTERLILRQLQSSDDKAIFTLRNNAQVNAFIQRPITGNIYDARHFISTINEGINNSEWLYWAIILKSNQQLVGTICMWHFSNDNTMAEIGYELHPDYQGKGLMNEAIQTIIDYGFNTLDLKTIEAYTQPANTKSVTLLEKNGFLPDSTSNQPGTSREVRFILNNPVI
jgi:ribosomal-protein-alanine N-acetyltransferase